MAERSIFQSNDGGSNPALTLRDLRVMQCAIADIKSVMVETHYSHSIFGVTTDHCFAVLAGSDVVGGAIFGQPGAYNVAAKYSDGLPLTELRRFVLIDECPRNSESMVLGVMLRTLRARGVRRVLSYADPAHGHSGIIYRALGFAYLGRTAARKHVMWKGKKYPDRNIHQVNFPFHLELRDALAAGDATRVAVPGKHIFLKRFD